MNVRTRIHAARGYAIAVGAMDFLTGVGLLLGPALTLALMRVASPPMGALVYVRFIGVFVAAVGASYLWAAANSREALRTVLSVTLFFRVGAALFTAVAVAWNAFQAAWLIVAGADLACVAVQAVLLTGGLPDD